MPLTVNFSTSQTLGEPSVINLVDSTTGSDSPNLVVSRRVYLTDSSGATYVQTGTLTTYEVWASFPSITTISLDVLPFDLALNVRVDYIDSAGTVLYTKTVLTVFLVNLKSFYINLIKSMSSKPKLIDHANFYPNMIKLISSIQEATDAIGFGADIKSSQAAINRGKQLFDNPSLFY